ncbi:MAG: hypothetical protein ACI9EF_001064 [Pseudohongiellaceae bacterium]|jgi:hypothetical protein
MIGRHALIAASLLTCGTVLVDESNPPVEQPIELGTVRWERNHDTAFARAKQADTPVFLLFQEIPG